jgi:glycosyltransferase involved in cell wall biosynthesis
MGELRGRPQGVRAQRLARRESIPANCGILTRSCTPPPEYDAGLRVVSIVISSFNYERFLAQAIDSALSQTWPPVEVIVVDDGSTDASQAVIERYGAHVHAIVKPNGGQGSTLNAGFARSRGDVVMFLDSDDVLLPTAVEQVVAAMADPAVVNAQLACHGNRRGGHADWPDRSPSAIRTRFMSPTYAMGGSDPPRGGYR